MGGDVHDGEVPSHAEIEVDSETDVGSVAVASFDVVASSALDCHVALRMVGSLSFAAWSGFH